MGCSTLDGTDKRLEASDDENKPAILNHHIKSEDLQLKKWELNLRDISSFLNILRQVREMVWSC